MKPDDELCLCFHITWRKTINFIRLHRPQKPSQLAECGGAGTGCGWCRKQLTKLAEQVTQSPPSADQIEEWLANRSPDRKQYESGRAKYREAKGIDDPPGP